MNARHELANIRDAEWQLAEIPPCPAADRALDDLRKIESEMLGLPTKEGLEALRQLCIKRDYMEIAETLDRAVFELGERSMEEGDPCYVRREYRDEEDEYYLDLFSRLGRI